MTEDVYRFSRVQLQEAMRNVVNAFWLRHCNQTEVQYPAYVVRVALTDMMTLLDYDRTSGQYKLQLPPEDKR